ncbi:MAG: hypothetical protein AAGC74_03000 [Verrucomicrobiota bacterium]
MVLFPLLLAQLPIPDWKMVHSLDSDQNDRISLAEFHSDPAIFKLIDSNNDDEITFEEVQAARKQTPAPPQLDDPAPKLTALDTLTNRPVPLHNRERPFALIFGTFT